MPDATAAETRTRYERWNRRLNASWSAADYAKIGVTLQSAGEDLADAADFAPGSSVLDVAAGNGNVSLALARRFCHVTSTDFVPAMLEKGRARARAEDLDITFQIADAQDLPFGDAAFDGVASTFGVMFAPDQPRAAAELLRVCRPGGKVALACWTPTGFIGRVCATIGRSMAASGDFKSPQNWGREDWIREHFASSCTSLSIEPRQFSFRYPSPRHYLEYNRANYGLMHKAFERVGAEGEEALSREILAEVAAFNTATDGTMRAPSDYLRIVMVRA